MHKIQPYILVPTLIEQPTWGGDYIVSLKQLDSAVVTSKIGQSYELFRDSHLSEKRHTAHNPSIDISSPSEPGNPRRISYNDKPFHISELIIKDPVKTLGKKMIDAYGHSIEILVKLNHARGNSYQVHAKARTQTSRWIPKPESWYFFEKGLVTLGLKTNIDVQEYKRVCLLIEKESSLISKSITQGIISTEKGRNQLERLIKKHDPQSFVNLVQIAKNTAVDLSSCGVHHSWEQNDITHPQGNIVYEVQKNVYDPDCTIRSFDKGKIKEDGTVRKMQIEDYFLHLDKSEKANKPETHYTKGKILKHSSTQTVKQIFSTNFYHLEEWVINKTMNNLYTTTTNAYHHLFVRKGTMQLSWQDQIWTVTQGFSVFIPASVGKYSIKPYKSKSISVLLTTLK